MTALAGQTIAVYCASSSAVASHYFDAACRLGQLLAENGASLVYGGTKVGLMGAVAEAVLQNGGSVIGVVPALINEAGISHSGLTELILTDGMRERKAVMEERADAFVVLPGGYGTWEEFFEVLTLKQLGYHNKAIVLLNMDGYYDGLLELFHQATDLHFMKPSNLALFQAVRQPEEVIEYLASYNPTQAESKWIPPQPVTNNEEIPGSE